MTEQTATDHHATGTSRPDAAAIAARLTGPGGPFEVVVEEVMGERLAVFKNRARSLRELLEGSRRHAEKEYAAFTDGSTWRRFTYGDHLALVASTATALREEYGIGPGDRVAILAANCPEWIVAFWATVSLGAIAVGLNGWWTGPEIRYGVDDADPKLLIADAKRLARVEGHQLGVPVVEIESGFDDLWHRDAKASLPDHPIAEDDPAVILYTSGTTGRPKGAINTHRNVIAFLSMNLYSGALGTMLAPPDPHAPPPCSLIASPLFHVSGLHGGALVTLATGIRSVWLTGRFDPVVAMRVIEQERVTSWAFTGTVLHRVVNHPEIGRYDLSSLRTLGGGGSPIAPSLQRRAQEVLPGVRRNVRLGYGSTETAAQLTAIGGDELNEHPDSAGRPHPTVELQIRDADGNVLPDGVEGEVCARGPMIMPGYWRRPDADAESFWPGRWLRMGDIGRIVDGRLYLSSRKRDLIFRGGENVYPVEIEQRLEEHPAVAEAAVVGVEHAELGQEVKAVVVLEPQAHATVEELRAWCAETLAYYKVPAHWELRAEALPRNATGKVVKAALQGADPGFVPED